jgi:hypothetical protein
VLQLQERSGAQGKGNTLGLRGQQLGIISQ